MSWRAVLARALALACLAAPIVAAHEAHAYPDQPIVIVVPTQAGGGVDNTARQFAQAIEQNKLLPVPVVIKNMPGSGGVIGMRAVRDAAADGYTIGLWNLSISASKVLGVSDFGITALDIVAQTGTSETVVATSSDSKFKTLPEVIDYARANDGKVLDATNIGTMPFFSTLVLAQTAGVRFRPVQTGGGAERLKAILGGHADIAVFGTDVYQQQAGSLRALALLSARRNAAIPDVPTAKELGYDAVFDNPDLWLAPKGVPQDRLDVLREALRKATETDLVKQGAMGSEIVFKVGPELEADMAAREEVLGKTAGVAIEALKALKKQ